MVLRGRMNRFAPQLVTALACLTPGLLQSIALCCVTLRETCQVRKILNARRESCQMKLHIKVSGLVGHRLPIYRMALPVKDMIMSVLRPRFQGGSRTANEITLGLRPSTILEHSHITLLRHH